MKVLEADFSLAGFACKSHQVALDFAKGLLIAVAEDRNDEPFLRADGHSDVIVFVLDQIVSVDPRIDAWGGLERVDH